MNGPQRLTELRLNRGLSVREAARQMEVAEQSLRRAEAGESVRPSVAFRIAGFYGRKVTDFWPVDGVAA